MSSDKIGCDNLDQLARDGTDEGTVLEALAVCLAEDVRRFALARCGDSRADVEDITQDAMLAAQRYLSSFRGDASLRTWMYKLVMSACSRRRRGRKNDPALHRPLEHAEEVGTGGSDPELDALVSERLAALRGAMQELRDEDRELLGAAEWEEQSMEQIARRFALTVPAVKSRLFRVRRQLRERVQQRFADPAAPADGEGG